MQVIIKKTFLIGMILCGVLMFSTYAGAFGLLVEHVLFVNNEPAKLADFEKQGVEGELDIHQNIITQLGATAKIRQTLGDTRVTYEKDRLIATIKDYDTIMRSLIFFQVRDKNLIENNTNKAFKNFYRQLVGSGQVVSTNNTNAKTMLHKILNSPKSAILQAKDNTNAFVSDPLEAGENLKKEMFLHAYTESDKNRVPASTIEALTIYRKSLVKEVATRNFLLGMYARAYLAERAEGNGIGRYLYGYDVALWDEVADPWSRSFNIVVGVSGTVNNVLGQAFTSVWDGLQTVQKALNTDVINATVNSINNFISFFTGRSSNVDTSSEPIDLAVSSKEETVNISSLAYGSVIDIPTQPLQDICTPNSASTKNAREQYMECIWNKFYASRKSEDAVSYTLTSKDKSEMRVIAANIRQMLSVNTIMWVRASLEMSNLILLSSAMLELEAISSAAALGVFWIYPPSYETWGDNICNVSAVPEDVADGTGWSQDCLTLQERKWLTPSFDWSTIKDSSSAVRKSDK